MSEFLQLINLVSINPRFARSVSLARDSHRLDAFEGYILTPTGRDVLGRLANALNGKTTTRAWSLTGPYGSGKSAFALIAARVLSGDPEGKKYLNNCDPKLANQFFGSGSFLYRSKALCPILVTGSRQPLEKSLAKVLANELRTHLGRGRPPQIIDKLEDMAENPGKSGTAIVALFEEANEYLGRLGKEQAGLLLIVDELGKFLEFGATNPDQGDIFVLQELAEAATRSKRPFLVITVLHQAIDRYAEHMSPGRRAEWAKVQGRFDDVAFEERTENLLRLLAHAIHQKGDEKDLKPLRTEANLYAKEAAALGVRTGAMTLTELKSCLSSCFPLHPFAALVLGPLFKQLAQNERSLFAFLGSSEPFGFREYLQENTLKDGPYSLDRLYDYVINSLGSTLFAQHRGKNWSEVQSVLDRLHDATALEIRLAKTIGFLQALGPTSNLIASEAFLNLALRDFASEKEIGLALKDLTKRSIVVFRRHLGSYALWEGSDIIIDDRLKAASQAVDREQSLAKFLTKQAPIQGLIARRHYFLTGTLRYFEVIYCDRNDFNADLFQTYLTGKESGADGRLLFCLPRDPEEREAMGQIITPIHDEPIIACLPGDVFDLRELCHDLVCLRWVEDHTPEFEADRTARRELRSRLVMAEKGLNTHIEWVFSPGNTNGHWFYSGNIVELKSRRELNDLISKACDDIYSFTPHWRNELINRRALSTSAAAARRNLIEAIFEHASEECLGFEGHPPERGMYETLLKVTRIHRKQGEGYAFLPPDAKAEPAVREVWKAINIFLDNTENKRESVAKLFAILRDRPFGLKDGVLPILLAVVLAHGHSQVALYEEGSFVPRPNAAVFERIFRSPEKYELQKFSISGPRAEVFQQYDLMISRSEGKEIDLLGIVRPLLRVLKDLPEYVGKTKKINEVSQRVLKVMKEARQPDRLLFVDLPVACGFPGFPASGKVDNKQVKAYFSQLKLAFTEIQGAYPLLLAEIEKMILAAFKRNEGIAEARKIIEHEARYVLNIAIDQKLKAFLMRVSDASTSDSTWLESIATLLANKPPTNWDDHDRARFEVQLTALARTFENFKSLAFEMESKGAALLDGDPQMMRVSVTSPHTDEVERIVKIPPELQKQAERAKKQLLRVLKDENLLDKKGVGASVLAELLRQLLIEDDQH